MSIHEEDIGREGEKMDGQDEERRKSNYYEEEDD